MSDLKPPFFNAPSPAAQNLELLRKHFPQAIEIDAQDRIRINAAVLQLALDPANPAGVQVEEDGFELRWVGKREAYHSAFVPVQKILQPLPGDSKHWDSTGNLLIKGDNLDALRLLRHGGVLIVNDALWHNRVADEADESDETIIIREALEAVTASESYTQALLPVGNGLLVAVKD